MTTRVTRRDFLNGVALGAGGLLLPACDSATESTAGSSIGGPATAGPPKSSINYPPALTGMRGSHEGSFEVAHALAWRGEKPTYYEDLDEHYDLVVVGAGMSGLAAAWYWRQKMGIDARILLLDNHDDFGGHAKRNEFHHDGRMVLSLGGAQNLESPGSYSDNAKDLLAGIGISKVFLDEMAANTPEDYVLGGNLAADVGMALPSGDRLVTTNGNWTSLLHGGAGYAEAIGELPLPETEKARLIEFVGGSRDFLDGKSLREKYRYCRSVSYYQYLTDDVGLARESLDILDNQLRIFYGMTGGSLSVLEALANGAPGLKSMGWLAGVAGSMLVPMAEYFLEVRMFPDGNASVARLLVQNLIPAVAPHMRGPEDVAVARFDYDALDLPSQNTRLRLNSTAVGVRENEQGFVEVDYVRRGRAQRVMADHCILACYNGIVPHLCPQMPEVQKEALSYGVKMPFIYVNVLLKDGRAFEELGVSLVQCPGGDFQWISAAPTMAIGGYEPPRGPDDPMALFLMSSPTPAPKGSESGRDLLRFARHRIYSTRFATYEQQVRDQLQALLGTHGFDHAADILAITVNRISHGYAYDYLELDDPEFAEGEAPHEVGRAQFGRISIANSDSEARAYMDAAWDAAWRAVEEQARAGAAPTSGVA